MSDESFQHPKPNRDALIELVEFIYPFENLYYAIIGTSRKDL